MGDMTTAPQPVPEQPPSREQGAESYEDWRLLQEVLEERDREWWADAQVDADADE